MATSKTRQSKIDQLRVRYIEATQDKKSLIKILSETEISDHVYNSNAIENSTLTLQETEKLLLQIELDRFVTAREINEAKNLARVMQYVEKHAENRKLTFDTILFLHNMLIGNIQPDIAGRFRKEKEFVMVGSHIAPAPDFIIDLLTVAFTEYEVTATQPIISRIARLHLEFERVHPFNDGNGRIGRVINNYLLMRDGYVPINIKFSDRKLYYSAFSEYGSEGAIVVMEKIIELALLNSYHRRLAYAESKKIVRLKEYATHSGQSYSSLLNRANRQTIPAFREQGRWMIGT